LQIYENFKGDFVDTLKRQIPRQHFNQSEQCLNLSTFIKDESRTSWRAISAHRQGTKQWLKSYWSSEADGKPSIVFEEA